MEGIGQERVDPSGHGPLSHFCTHAHMGPSIGTASIRAWYKHNAPNPPPVFPRAEATPTFVWNWSSMSRIPAHPRSNSTPPTRLQLVRDVHDYSELDGLLHHMSAILTLV